ncbi:hypothetical protein EVAR_45570_1 [Eumeta japonica]|uniref:Costars domain-containing protein n=1 Tax=Eumeta variegata TaxID=151549 RepID=A0A4C1YQF3_EUMVA|nr:hypothetical protein EVAR_45570_1 [Eumeta japonica]
MRCINTHESLRRTPKQCVFTRTGARALRQRAFRARRRRVRVYFGSEVFVVAANEHKLFRGEAIPFSRQTRNISEKARLLAYCNKSLISFIELDSHSGHEVDERDGLPARLYTVISDKLVGILLRTRKHQLTYFEGEVLFQTASSAPSFNYHVPRWDSPPATRTADTDVTRPESSELQTFRHTAKTHPN